MTVPYEGATTGNKARDEIVKVLRRFGCESVGFMDDFEKSEIFLAFKHRGRPIQLRASAKGWAQMYLKENPYTHRRSGNQKGGKLTLPGNIFISQIKKTVAQVAQVSLSKQNQRLRWCHHFL